MYASDRNASEWTFKWRLAVPAALGACLTLAGGGCWAADAMLPPVHTEHGVHYLSGGVGGGEARAIERAAPHWPVTLEFAVQDQRDKRAGADYLADVHVRVRDAHGHEVLQTVASGPFLLAKLPPGHYQVEAKFAGRTLDRALEVKPGAPIHSVFVWPEAYVDRAG